ncbi:hypothetical protein COCOBI_19-0230 [Coccomyxa sp. Obi]|nr:hypothetical protein COCOBI_19-0230 [Coccomyxa sp. Obi]
MTKQSTSSLAGVVPVRPPPPPLPGKGDLDGEDLKYASRRVVQIFTQVEGRPSTAVPLGTGALIMKDVIVTPRHTVVDRDGVFVDPFVDGRKLVFIIANPAADLALLKLPSLSEASGAAVLHARNHLAGDLPELFETDKEKLWAVASAKFNQAEAESIQESYQTKYPGERAVITPAHHKYKLLAAAGLSPRDPLCHYPTHLAKG